MSDQLEAPTSEEEDTPTPTDDAPEPGQAPEAPKEEGVDLDTFDLTQIPEEADREWFEGKYNALRADYSRKTQSAAEARKQAQRILDAARDPKHPDHAEVMDYLGFEVADDDEEIEVDEDNPQALLEQRLARLEAERQQERETAQQREQREAYESEIVSRLDELKLKHGIENFEEEELALLVNTAAGIPDEEGLPNVDKAYDLLTGAYGKRQKAYLQGKKTAPKPPGNGVPATRGLDITDRDARLEAAIAAAERAGSE